MDQRSPSLKEVIRRLHPGWFATVMGITLRGILNSELLRPRASITMP